MKSLKDPYFRAKACNYVAFALTIGKEPEGPAYFQESLKTALLVPDEDKRLDLLKYLTDNQTAAGNSAASESLRLRLANHMTAQDTSQAVSPNTGSQVPKTHSTRR